MLILHVVRGSQNLEALPGLGATLTDKDRRAVYAFNCLLTLFPQRKPQIVKTQVSLEACSAELQQFRNNVAFPARAEIVAHIQARIGLRDENVYLDLVSAIGDFKALMKMLIDQELEAIPELPDVLVQLQVTHLPVFSSIRTQASGEVGQ